MPVGGEGGRLSVALESLSVPFGGKLKLEDDDETFPSRLPSLSIELETAKLAMDRFGGILAWGSYQGKEMVAVNVECSAWEVRTSRKDVKRQNDGGQRKGHSSGW